MTKKPEKLTKKEFNEKMREAIISSIKNNKVERKVIGGVEFTILTDSVDKKKKVNRSKKKRKAV